MDFQQKIEELHQNSLERLRKREEKNKDVLTKFFNEDGHILHINYNASDMSVCVSCYDYCEDNYYKLKNGFLYERSESGGDVITFENLSEYLNSNDYTAAISNDVEVDDLFNTEKIEILNNLYDGEFYLWKNYILFFDVNRNEIMTSESKIANETTLKIGKLKFNKGKYKRALILSEFTQFGELTDGITKVDKDEYMEIVLANGGHPFFEMPPK